jgi:hypothetical protein
VGVKVPPPPIEQEGMSVAIKAPPRNLKTRRITTPPHDDDHDLRLQGILSLDKNTGAFAATGQNGRGMKNGP